MRAEIIATGSELLSGGLPETNSLFLSGELLTLGIETAFKTVVGDNEKDLEEAVRRALERADAVIVTGGIGPTDDDITRKAVAKITKRRLVLNEDALAAVKAVFSSRNWEYHGANDRQALLPAGARLLANPVGVAPGFILEEEGKVLAVLPGVPEEMRAMFSAELRPALEGRSESRRVLRRRSLHTCGLSESAVNQAVQDLMRAANPSVGITAVAGGVDIHILVRENSRKRALAVLESTETEVRKRLGDAVYGIDGQEMEEIVGALLKQRGQTLAVAESCTGGMIGSRITNVAGSSAYFERGVVVYSNRSKTELLSVPAELIERHGAVSRETAEAMAQGVRQAAKTDLGLAVTGIAGPDGGSAEKPVGLVYIALASASGAEVKERRFSGTRGQIRQRAAQFALDMIRRYLIA